MKDDTLLRWLAKEDDATYGECHGVVLDRLVKKGLATVSATGDGFGPMYRRVSLTQKGWERVKEIGHETIVMKHTGINHP